jgi:hypothetical protein
MTACSRSCYWAGTMVSAFAKSSAWAAMERVHKNGLIPDPMGVPPVARAVIGLARDLPARIEAIVIRKVQQWSRDLSGKRQFGRLPRLNPLRAADATLRTRRSPISFGVAID